MKAKTLIIAVLVFLGASVALSDSYVTSRDSITASATDIYYPVCPDLEGSCNGSIPSGVKFPGVILLQGGSVDAQYYSSIAFRIAASGYIVAVPNAPKSFFGGIPVQLTSPNVSFAAKLLLIALDSSSYSNISGRLLPNTFGILGHSFGGVAAIIAGSLDAANQCAFPFGPLRFLCAGYQGFGDGLKGIATYGTSLVDRFRLGGYTRFDTNTSGVPIALVLGKEDGRALSVDVTDTYNLSLETPKALIHIDNANHFGITDAQVLPGSSVDTNIQTKSQDWSVAMIGKVFQTFLDAHLKDNANARDKIYGTMSVGGSAITVVQSQND
jgi:dienelactone hydrolase